MQPTPDRPSAQPDERWRIRRTRDDLDRLGETESIFALSNGWLGWRGTLDEGAPVEMPGSYLNGLHERRALNYPEDGYAFPQLSDTVISAPNATLVRLWVDGEPLDLRTGTLLAHEQVLDLRAGVLERLTEWISPAGRGVRVRSTRLVSLPRRRIAAVDWTVEPLDGPVDVRISADLLANERVPERADDPRAASLIQDPLVAELHHVDDADGLLVHRTEHSGQRVAVAVAHRPTVPEHFASDGDATPDRIRLTLTGSLRPGEQVRLTRFAAYEWAPVDGSTAEELAGQVVAEADAARTVGFETLFAEQRAAFDEAWRTADVVLDGDEQLQLAIRFAMFHLIQAGRSDGDRTIPAKGLTGNGYDGHVLWDTEGYVLAALTYVAPEVVRSALRWRHRHLPQALDRAAELRLTGATFPWRTISGRECSGYWPAGTAALHVNADLADAVLRYAGATGDQDFLTGAGLDLLVATARLWHGFGHFTDDGVFHLVGVTGPDEYAALVDDNLFTNLMARRNLRGAADAVERYPEAGDRLGVDPAEVAGWRAAADAMAVPYDAKRGVHQQAAGFTARPEWDFAGTGDDDYPLLLHFPYLELYRHQVVKQADLVLAMLRCPGEFTAEEKAANFAYYEARTVRDSSLSAAPQGVLAAELGHLDLAYDLFAESVLQDLEDLGDKTGDGLHLASLGGAWLALVQGFGGLRDDRERLSFDPRLPRRIDRLAFSLRWHGHRLLVTLTADEARYELPDAEADAAMELWHHGEWVRVTADAPVRRPMPPLPDFGDEPPSPPGRRPARR
ncbi:alpha,alpha-trehalose phosphorylase [Micromonospora phaseoli]|uniref:Alpha,alpha-trehalose phosphorylase n=1 Tax=Micromonospora phaseoli TaxID=1144548 RepID=A0A1H7AXE4_9ACTN|nr:glycosyl hydrolase family 65 protein [Micromonospora phaseoli]PZV96147.1 alpha,alpha-trehalose phosphorylase [Micromonospora phaseoli]GIJ79421.1 glycosyl hydrolase [Micromonospora phaseoli]SEJ69586.1 alpha,alpha-trehalose phosphorylase [Micromonospora phaseoli]